MAVRRRLSTSLLWTLALLAGCARPGASSLRLVDARVLDDGSPVVSERWTSSSGRQTMRLVLLESAGGGARVLFEQPVPAGGRGGELHLRDDLGPWLLVARQEWTGPDGERRPGRLAVLSTDGPAGAGPGAGDPEWIDTRAELDPLGRELAASPALLGAGGALCYLLRTEGEGELWVRTPAGELRAWRSEDGEPRTAQPEVELVVAPDGRSLEWDGARVPHPAVPPR